MKIKVISLFFALFFILLSNIGIFAYVTYPQSVLTVDKDEIKVGETVNATVEIIIPPFAKLLQTEDDIFVEGWDIQDFYFTQDILDEYKFTLNLSITTFNSDMDSSPRVKLSYINKEDLFDDSFFCDKFYFFSNSVPVKVNSIVSDYDKEEIFDIKKTRKMEVPIIFYILSLFFVLFVLFVVYRNVLMLKVRKELKFILLPGEKAIRDLNNICNNNKQMKMSYVSDYYYQMSRVLKVFILDGLSIENKEMTTMEVISVINDESNPFYKLYNEIVRLFKIYDNAKYSVSPVSLREFCDVFNRTKQIIENLSASVKFFEEK